MDFYYPVTPPGLEHITALELSALNLLPVSLPADKPDLIASDNLQSAFKNLQFQGGLPALYRANLHLRTASRILVRLGMPFMARTFPELVEKASRLPWERFLHPGQPVALRVTSHKSALYHTEAIAERLLVAIQARLGKPSPRIKPGNDEENTEGQLILARLVDDKCTVSIDSSGQLLHRRGYRLETAKAPLRENLAAALILTSGWDKTAPLLDPFCGSGTLVIEAALLALGIPPGLHRQFAFMRWPGFDKPLWESLIPGPQAPIPNQPPLILASDRDSGAIRIAQANAERAGVLEHIQFSQRAVSAIEPPQSPGWVVTNPPYGVRVSEDKDLRNLYAQLGHVLRAHCPGWSINLLGPDPILMGHTGLKLTPILRFTNGGLKVQLLQATVP